MRRVIGGLVGGGVAIFAGANAVDDNTTRDESGEIVEGGGLGVFAINVRDCIQLPGVEQLVESVEGVPCGQPHDAQVYAEFDLPGGAFPGQATVDDQGSRGCYDRWQAAVGTVYEQDLVLDFTYFTPQREGWEAGDHEIQCMIVRIDGSRMVGDQL
jgi:hypothetical protein